ncbi:hypothetical protein HK104_005116 [Borealophlyctis nickersoniae]|nr:hypothetical protein HK104_005116 [Borealophlyctis nickersoniae]
MPPAVSKKKTGLGKALMRSRFTPNAHHNPDGSIRHTTELEDSAVTWMRMQSVTDENDLDAFLNTAELAGTEFTAERMNIKVVTDTYVNPFLLTPEKEQETLQKHEEHKHLLTIPRRPAWDVRTTAEQLQLRERNSFLDWRRGLAILEEEKGLLMTPYERNLEIWRQLWRVIERSDLIVQIVDARNPDLFRSTDLESYVKEVDERKKNLLLVNKADMLTAEQRTLWADYFEKHGIRYTFFSAALAREKLDKEEEERRAKEEEAERKLVGSDGREQTDDVDEEDGEDEEDEGSEEGLEEGAENVEKADTEEGDGTAVGAGEAQSDGGLETADEPERIRILGALELIDMFTSECPTSLRTDDPKAKVTIGFVGYPNVGKSSTLNALVGAKRVAVASTPGKTKHFQTIHLSDSIVLCDCPGLVFPSFATTKAEMVCNGVLPIDQLREFTGPAELVAKRIPKEVLEGTYGIKIKTRDGEGREVSRLPTGEELLKAYAISRGFTKSSQGNPDEARAARYVLKDYVNGKLLFAHPPSGIDATKFNENTYKDPRFIARKAAEEAKEAAKRASGATTGATKKQSKPETPTSLDAEFFSSTPIIRAGSKGKYASADVTRTKMYPHQGGSLGSLDKSSKKGHKKGKKHVKVRTQWTKE